MKTIAIGLLMLLAAGGGARAAALTPAETLCATNPAFSPDIMLSIVQGELEKDHDPSLDGEPPDKLAQEASAQGISECAADLQKDRATYAALSALPPSDRVVGWDAYNTTCADHVASKGDCISNEVGAEVALKRMSAKNQPEGAKNLVQVCQLVLQTDPVMTEWRQCVDAGLAVHAPASRAASCRTSVGWHTAKTGAEAGKIVAACLSSK